MYGFRLRLSITRLRFIIPACAVLSAAGFVQSAVPEKPTAPQLTITSQSMTAQGKERRAIFEGDVVLTQGDLIIYSDYMVVTFKREEGGTKQESEQGGFGQQIERAVATSNVVIEKST
ncbi:MAG: LptA/OstA family protein, partial [Nitrospirota bacterium]|nr:LptA/OstA family protein [Nitrospirota bacterium]